MTMIVFLSAKKLSASSSGTRASERFRGFALGAKKVGVDSGADAGVIAQFFVELTSHLQSFWSARCVRSYQQASAKNCMTKSALFDVEHWVATNGADSCNDTTV